MSEAPVKVAINVGDAALAERIAMLLAEAAGFELVRKGDGADIEVVAVQGSTRPELSEVALTEREKEVLALLAEGASNKLIARRLGISTHTVKYHVASIVDKLDAVGRTDAVAYALRVGLIQA